MPPMTIPSSVMNKVATNTPHLSSAETGRMGVNAPAAGAHAGQSPLRSWFPHVEQNIGTSCRDLREIAEARHVELDLQRATFSSTRQRQWELTRRRKRPAFELIADKLKVRPEFSG